ncbi:SERTA domain-containing protein 2-like [Antennarius striatus]|uniref:SERTA domain-containing protein 2-like n=1 Tax=Antennarius striatus TaxID=241820 RepID=UPI0035B03033
MSGVGVKRKLEAGEDGPEGGGRPLGGQRQAVLRMSLMKLYGPRIGGGGAPPGLRRRVLINNIIRRIHDDYRRERGVSFFSAAPQAPPPPAPFGVLTALDSPCLTPASLLEEDLPVFFTLPPSPTSSNQHLLHLRPPPPPSPPPPPPGDNFSSALEEIEELGPSSSSPAPPLPPPPRLLFDVVMKEEGRSFQEAESRLERPTPPPIAPPSSSFLTDFTLDDVLFTDIDTSMYDLAPCPPPSGAPPTKGTPVAVADGPVRYGPAGAGAQSPPFKMDLAELDHIMEVLVGS